MQVRQFIDKYPGVLALLALILIALAVVKILWLDNRSAIASPPTTATVLFYDLTNGTLAPMTDSLPTTASIKQNPSTGFARAYAYSCAGCKDIKEYKTAYIELFTTDSAKSLQASGLPTYTLLDAEPSSQITAITGPNARFVKKPGPSPWLAWESPEGQKLRSDANQLTCTNTKPVQFCNN
jgi:hypothetical protein